MALCTAKGAAVNTLQVVWIEKNLLKLNDFNFLASLIANK